MSFFFQFYCRITTSFPVYSNVLHSPSISVEKICPLVSLAAVSTSIFHPITRREQVTAASVYVPGEAAVDGWPKGRPASSFHTPRNTRNKMQAVSRSRWSIRASRWPSCRFLTICETPQWSHGSEKRHRLWQRAGQRKCLLQSLNFFRQTSS